MLNLINAKQCLQSLGRSPRRILIVGCGSEGEDVKAFNELLTVEAEIHGVDVVDSIGRSYAADNVTYIQADIAEFPVRSRSYDLAYSFATFEHVPRIGAGWQRMIDTLRPGGILWCVASPLWCSPFGHHKRTMFQKYPYAHLRYPTPAAMMNFCAENGITSPDGIDISHHVRYMLHDNFFNKLKASDYLNAASNLQRCKIEKNSLDLLPPSTLVAARDLLEAGYTQDDLLGQTHRLIAISE